MPLTKKTKVVIGASVGGVVLAAAIAVTIYMALKKSGGGSGPTPTPSPTGPTWTCVNDTQNSYMLLYTSPPSTSPAVTNEPCAKFSSQAQCQAAATAGTLVCSCPTGQVLQGSASGVCVPICLGAATWDSSQNSCVCPSGTQFNPSTLSCETPPCSPPLFADQTTGSVTGYFKDPNSGICTNVTSVKTAVPYLTTFCQNTPCLKSPECPASGATNFVGFDFTNDVCIPPTGCNGQPYYYTWPDGNNTCPGLTYSNPPSGSANSACVPPDNNALQIACEYTAGGCPSGTTPIQPGEVCTNGGSCRLFGDTPTCTGAGGTETCTYSNCVPPQQFCPVNTTLSTTCSSSPLGPCLDSKGNCVSALAGCRPPQENWKYSNGVCLNVTENTCLELQVDSASTVLEVQVTATVDTSLCPNVPLTTLQYRYVLATSAGADNQHWSGVVSKVQVSSASPNQVALTFYPDQSVSPVPANVTLNLFLVGMIQQPDGSWTASISSPNFADPKVATCQLKAATQPCLPTLNFAPNIALNWVPQLATLPSNQTQVYLTDAASKLGLSSAASKPFVKSGSFAGAIVPVSLPPYGTKSVSQMFVVLAWTPLTPSALSSNQTQGPVTYVVQRMDGQGTTCVYSGPLTVLVDVVSVTSANSVTFSVQAQTGGSGSGCSLGTCVSQPQYTTCPPLQYLGEMCTSMKVGSSATLLNFLIPDPDGSCITIPSGNNTDAAYYYCTYLQNKDRSIAGLQVPNSGSNPTQCMSIVPVTSGVMINPLKQNTLANGNPSGYCTDSTCPPKGYNDTTRTAVCACGADAQNCLSQANTIDGLPFLQLSGADGSTATLSASDFSTNMKGMVDFMNTYKGLQF